MDKSLDLEDRDSDLNRTNASEVRHVGVPSSRRVSKRERLYVVYTFLISGSKVSLLVTGKEHS